MLGDVGDVMYEILKFFDFLELFAAMCSQQNFDMLGKDVEFEEEQKSLSGKPGIGLSSLIHFDLFELPPLSRTSDLILHIT